MRRVVYISIALNLVLSAVVLFAIERRGGLEYVNRVVFGGYVPNLYRINRESVFEPVGNGTTVLLGDSILAFMPHEFVGEGYANRAVRGVRTDYVIDHLGELGEPRQVVLHVGINDLQEGVPPGEVAQNIRFIAERLENVRVIPLLPVNAPKFEEYVRPNNPTTTRPSPEDVAAVNEGLKGLDLVDTSPLLENGQIADPYTIDGLHLNGTGLKMLASML